MIKLYLKKGREDSVKRFHPWIFSGAIASFEGGQPAEGDVVAVYSASGDFLASGHYQIGSIAVRILSFDEPELPDDFFRRRLERCLALRKSLFSFALSGSEQATDCYRLVHGEGDGLPGLIVDYYDGVCVLQAHSVGMFLAKEKICRALEDIYGDSLKAVYDKSSGTAPFKAGLELNDGYLYRADSFSDGCAGITVRENGHLFKVDWENGQKTGFFLDQRENRSLVERYASGRRVLNLFCYTGGFSVYALAGGALSVDSVDSSAAAIKLTEENVALNGFSDHKSFCEDAIDFVKNAPKDKYDLIIVDPPAFAKHRGALHNALRAYQRLNAAAIAAVAPGGFVFTFSCSQVVDRQAFSLAVFSAAAEVGRKVRILNRLCQGPDHSVSIYHPEGEYLKGLMLYVE